MLSGTGEQELFGTMSSTYGKSLLICYYIYKVTTMEEVPGSPRSCEHDISWSE